VENGRLIDRKLNVAMTRARQQLLMTGRQDVLVCNPLLAEIVSRYDTKAL
jgi:superfamily I DNA and/or RNA helicase